MKGKNEEDKAGLFDVEKGVWRKEKKKKKKKKRN